MMQLTSICTIPPEQQRYETAGDWIDSQVGTGYVSQISITTQKDWRYEACLAVHELVEMYICRHMGITTEEVDEFDMAHPELDEPGEHPDAPYYYAHQVATDMEVHLCQALGLDWKEYDAAITGKEKE